MMNKLLIIAFLFTSCKTANYTQENSEKVTFKTDGGVEEGLGTIGLSYKILSGINTVSYNLKPGNKQIIYLRKPTEVQLENYHYCFFPGDIISISGDTNSTIKITVEGDATRTRQLSFEKEVYNYNSKSCPRYPLATYKFPLDSVLQFDKVFEKESCYFLSIMEKIIDSLASKNNISADFKKTVFKNIQAQDLFTRVSFNTENIKVLKENNLYIVRQLGLLKKFEREQADNLNVYLGTDLAERFFDAIFDLQIRLINSEQVIWQAIDTINNNFNKINSEFLLTRIIYNAVYKNIPISKKLKQYYFKKCGNKDYKIVIRDLLISKKRFAKAAKNRVDNRIINQKTLKVQSIEDVIAKHKGKFILFDFWASWCVPCLEQHPYLNELMKKLRDKDIVFITLSMDKNILQWQLKSQELGFDSENSYVFENFKNQSFITKYNIETIPRYMLFDKNGELILADAPTPGSGELEQLILQNINQ